MTNPKPPKAMGRKRAFTAKQVDRIRHMKSEGLSNDDIARVMGVSKGTISVYLRGAHTIGLGD